MQSCILPRHFLNKITSFLLAVICCKALPCYCLTEIPASGACPHARGTWLQQKQTIPGTLLLPPAANASSWWSASVAFPIPQMREQQLQGLLCRLRLQKHSLPAACRAHHPPLQQAVGSKSARRGWGLRNPRFVLWNLPWMCCEILWPCLYPPPLLIYLAVEVVTGQKAEQKVSTRLLEPECVWTLTERENHRATWLQPARRNARPIQGRADVPLNWQGLGLRCEYWRVSFYHIPHEVIPAEQHRRTGERENLYLLILEGSGNRGPDVCCKYTSHEKCSRPSWFRVLWWRCSRDSANKDSSKCWRLFVVDWNKVQIWRGRLMFSLSVPLQCIFIGLQWPRMPKTLEPRMPVL